MRQVCSIACLRLLALCFTSWFYAASAAESIERNQVYRSVNPDWTDLGSTNYPFKNLYLTTVFLSGQQIHTTPILYKNDGFIFNLYIRTSTTTEIIYYKP